MRTPPPAKIVARFVRLDGKIVTKRIHELAPVVCLNPGDFGEFFELPVHAKDLIGFRKTDETHGEQPVYREMEESGERWVPPKYPGR